MSKQDGLNWARKAYIWLSLAVVAIIWIAFGVYFGIQGHSPVEANWFEEVMKWVVMTPILVVIVDGIFYAIIGTIASRKADGIDRPILDEIRDLLRKPEKEEEVVADVVEEQPAEEAPVVEEAAPVKKTRKKKVVEE